MTSSTGDAGEKGDKGAPGRPGRVGPTGEKGIHCSSLHAEEVAGRWRGQRSTETEVIEGKTQCWPAGH